MGIWEDTQAVSPVACAAMFSLAVEERVGVVRLNVDDQQNSQAMANHEVTYIDFVNFHVDIIGYENLTSVDHIFGVEGIVR